MSEPSDAEIDRLGGHPSSAVILTTDASAEGELVASALRARGFAVVDTALALVEGRSASGAPQVVLIDLDEPGAADVVRRLRDPARTGGPVVLCIADPDGPTDAHGLRGLVRICDRPIDIDALLGEISMVADPGAHASVGATMPPPSLRRTTTAPPEPADSDAPAPSEMPGSGDVEPTSIVPGFTDSSRPPRLLTAELSPELERLLASAEQRVLSQIMPASVPSPDEELDMILSPELLASLDEPLDAGDDDDAGTGSGLHQSTPGHAATGPGAHVPSPSDQGESEGAAASAEQAADFDEPYDARAASARGDDEPIETPPPTRATPSDAPGASSRGAADTAPPPRDEPKAAFEPFEPSESFDLQPSARAVATPMERPTPLPRPAPARAAKVAPPASSAFGEGGAIAAVARAVAARVSGSLLLRGEEAERRIVLHDGDIVTAASSRDDEALVAFLAARGDLERDVASRLAAKLPPFGRHAGAALIAHGHLGQDELWPILRAHAEWIIGRVLLEPRGVAEVEPEPPGRLRAEPSVFGGATGAEVFVETVRRVVPSDVALARIGGPGARITEGPRLALLGECALVPDEHQLVRSADGSLVGELVAAADHEVVNVFYALVALEVLEALSPVRPAKTGPSAPDPLDDEALRARVRARMALVEEGDYFALLGVSRSATGYDIRRAYVELRRSFEPTRALTGRTADLYEDVRLIVEVLDEAYDILRDPHRRERYRRAIEAGPPA